MDAKALDFGDKTFDCIIDKACFDTVVTGDGAAGGALVLAEVSRVLKPGGQFVVLSVGSSEERKPLFDLPEYGWALTATHNVRALAQRDGPTRPRPPRTHAPSRAPASS